MKARWPAEVKARAIAVAGETSAVQASLETGVPVGTIYNWVHRLVRSASAEIVVASSADVGTGARTRPWPERRAAVVGELMDGLDEVVVAARAAVRDGRLRDGKDGWLSAAIVIDKLQLLSGEATSHSLVWRHETRENAADEIAALERQLGLGSEGDGHVVDG